jgi:hypothetical protein
MSIKVQIVEVDSGEVIVEMEVRGATSLDDRKVKRIENGLLRQTNTDRYFIRMVDTEEATA